MDPERRIAEIHAQLLVRARLKREGVSDGAIVAELKSGAWVRIGNGCYVTQRVWSNWWPEERHIALALSARYRATVHDPVFSHVTAAAMWGFPSFDLGREPVHDTLPWEAASPAGSGKRRRRHRYELDREDVVDFGLLRCTSRERTLWDVAHVSTPEQAAVILDGGVRDLFTNGVSGAAEAWCAVQSERALRDTGVRGERIAADRFAAVDHRAESAAESLSRLNLRRLGYDVESQVEVPGPKGVSYRIDFEFVGLGVFGEVDGVAKYTDAKLLRDQTSSQAVLAEKRREDWVRGVTRHRFVRWGFREARDAGLLGARLRAFGVYPQG